MRVFDKYRDITLQAATYTIVIKKNCLVKLYPYNPIKKTCPNLIGHILAWEAFYFTKLTSFMFRMDRKRGIKMDVRNLPEVP